MNASIFLGFSLFISITSVFVDGECPIDESSYTKWSTLYGNIEDMANITITEKVVLDVPNPKEPFSITISGTLLFSDNIDIDLRVHYILVESQGSFIIGTEGCKHKKKVLITLVGEEDEYDIPNFNEKFIGVKPGGTFESHGIKKLPWAKLTETVHKVDGDHGLIFKHSDEDGIIKNKKGVYVHVFDRVSGESEKNMFVQLVAGGNVQKKINNNVAALTTFLDCIENGKIVAFAVNRFIIDGVGNLTEFNNLMQTLTGTTTLNNLSKYAAYAGVTVKGDTSQTVEDVTYDPNENEQFAAAELIFLDVKRKFRVESFVNIPKIGKSFLEFISSNTDFSVPIINLNTVADSWDVGDTLLLTSTDYDWNQAEECKMIACDNCSSTQVRLDCAPKFTHFGGFCANLSKLDMRGEVGDLTRNIQYVGETDIIKKFGGHFKVIEDCQNIYIEYSEFFHMGQNTAVGRYPIHFHMCFDVGRNTSKTSAYVRGNAIHHTFARATTIHGTHNLLYEYNVAYDTLGHSVFLEDGGEQNNTIRYNLVGLTRKTDLIDVDKKPASFWITNPKNNILNNIAFGGEGVGFWFIYPEEPITTSTGLGMMELHEARRTAIYEFSGNAAHSNLKAGLFIDNELSKNNTAEGYNRYKPETEVLLVNFTAFKNIQQNVWIRAGSVTLAYCALSDTSKSVTLVRENSDYPSMRNCIVIGDSCNKGEPQAGLDRSIPMPNAEETPRLGYIFQKGPNYLYDTYFGNFENTELYNASALAVEFREGGKVTTLHSVEGLEFGFDDSASNGNRITYKGEIPSDDDNYIGTFFDVDGSSTTQSGSQVVQTRDFLLTDDCKSRGSWGFSACPNKYGFIEVDMENIVDMIVARDDNPSRIDKSVNSDMDPRFMLILGGNYSYIAEFQSAVPSEFKITGQGVTRNEWVRLGICFPPDAVFELKGMNMPVNLNKQTKWNKVNTVAEVDDDSDGKSYMFDSTNGILFVKLINKNVRTEEDKNNCPNDKCTSIKVTITAGDLTNSKCRDKAYNNGLYTRSVSVQTATPYPAVLPRTADGPNEDWGASPAQPLPDWA